MDKIKSVNYEFCPYDFEKWIQNSSTLSFINEPHSSIVNFIMVRLLLSDVRKRIELQTTYQTKEGTNTTCSEEWYNWKGSYQMKGDTNTTCSEEWYNWNGWANPKGFPHGHYGQGLSQQEYSASGCRK